MRCCPRSVSQCFEVHFAVSDDPDRIDVDDGPGIGLSNEVEASSLEHANDLQLGLALNMKDPEVNARGLSGATWQATRTSTASPASQIRSSHSSVFSTS